MNTTTPNTMLDDTSTYTTATSKNKNASWIAAIVGAFIIGAFGGVVGGMQIGTSSSSSMSGMGGPGGTMTAGNGSGQMGGFGEVTAVDSDSITVKDQRQSTSTTYTITDSTTVSDDGSDAAVSDISVGDTVMIQTEDSSNDATATATSIQINPSMQGGPSGQTNSTKTN